MLSVGGIAGYNAASDQIAANKINRLIQQFYLGLETERANSDSEFHVVCANGNEGQNCKKQKYDHLCTTYIGQENCQTFTTGYWRINQIPGITGWRNLDNGPIHDPFVLWGYRTNMDETVYLQFVNLKPSVCEKILSELDVTTYPMLYGVGAYCNNACDPQTNNFSDKATIYNICHNNYSQAKVPVMTLLFDAAPFDLIDARDED